MSIDFLKGFMHAPSCIIKSSKFGFCHPVRSETRESHGAPARARSDKILSRSTITGFGAGSGEGGAEGGEG